MFPPLPWQKRTAARAFGRRHVPAVQPRAVRRLETRRPQKEVPAGSSRPPDTGREVDERVFEEHRYPPPPARYASRIVTRAVAPAAQRAIKCTTLSRRGETRSAVFRTVAGHQPELVARVPHVEIGVGKAVVELQVQVGVFFHQFGRGAFFMRPIVRLVADRQIEVLVDEDAGQVEKEVPPGTGCMTSMQVHTRLLIFAPL